MRVWVVESGHDYESGDKVVAVYDSEQGARDHLDRLMDDPEVWRGPHRPREGWHYFHNDSTDRYVQTTQWSVQS